MKNLSLLQEFMLCREEEGDPRRCLNEGKNVTACALDVLKKMKKNCLEDFNAYMYCLERSTGTLELTPYVILYSTMFACCEKEKLC